MATGGRAGFLNLLFENQVRGGTAGQGHDGAVPCKEQRHAGGVTLRSSCPATGRNRACDNLRSCHQLACARSASLVRVRAARASSTWLRCHSSFNRGEVGRPSGCGWQSGRRTPTSCATRWNSAGQVFHVDHRQASRRSGPTEVLVERANSSYRALAVGVRADWKRRRKAQGLEPRVELVFFQLRRISSGSQGLGQRIGPFRDPVGFGQSGDAGECPDCPMTQRPGLKARNTSSPRDAASYKFAVLATSRLPLRVRDHWSWALEYLSSLSGDQSVLCGAGTLFQT